MHNINKMPINNKSCYYILYTYISLSINYPIKAIFQYDRSAVKYLRAATRLVSADSSTNRNYRKGYNI